MVSPQPDLLWGVIQCWSSWKVFNGYIISFHASRLWGTQWLLFLRILRVPETHRVFPNPVYSLYLVSSSLKICEGNLLCAGTWLCSPHLGYQSLFRDVSQLPGVSYAESAWSQRKHLSLHPQVSGQCMIYKLSSLFHLQHESACSEPCLKPFASFLKQTRHRKKIFFFLRKRSFLDHPILWAGRVVQEDTNNTFAFSGMLLRHL